MSGKNLLTAEEIFYARDWLANCDWPDITEDEIDELSNKEIEQAVKRHYEGGVQEFKNSIIEIK